jgi:AcrR family transcriptional regulator
MPYPSKISLAAIADAALAVADQHGFSGLGIRPVADALGVRPMALYRYCGDADGLVSVVSERAATDLRLLAEQAIQAADPNSNNPVAAFTAMANAYRTYAERWPARYAALVTDTTRSTWSEQQGTERKALWNRVLAVVQRLTNNADDTDAAVAVWSFLHGFVALNHAGLFGASGPRNGFACGVTALVRGLAARA